MKSKKKKRIGMLLTYCMFILLGVASASVTGKAEETADGYKYSVNDDSSATITGYTGKDTVLSIPGEVDGHKVTAIGNWAFEDCDNMVGIVIPEGVTSIEPGAFSNCDKLASVVLLEGVISIGGEAFKDCSSLTSLTIPASVTDFGVSTGCSKLSEITVEAGNKNYYSEGNCIISKDHELVMGCKTSNIPKEVTSIGDHAFDGCYSLEEIIIPEEVIRIGKYAFYGCSSLTSAVIPKGVTRIETAAFRECSSLTSVTIPRSVTYIAGVDDDYWAPFSNANLLVYTALNSYAASWAEKQGYEVETINEGEEFEDGDNKYQYCVLDNDTVEIIDYTGTTKKLEIPATINDMVVSSIAEYAFSGCEVQNITIPASVTNIEYGAFVGLSSLGWITVAEGNEYYYSSGNCLISKEGELIAGCKRSVIPTGVKSIGKHAFRGCRYNYYDGETHTDVVIPNGVTHIGDFAFDESNSLENITIPSSVISIGRGTIGHNYTDGDGDKFSTCIHAVPGSYASEWAKKNDYDLISLSQTYEEEDVTYEYTVLDDETIRIDACFSEQEEINIPTTIDNKTVTSIGRRAFTECEEYLTSISIPDSVTSIGEYAFSECTALSEVSLSANSNLASIGDYAFYMCDSLETITIPNGVTGIGEGAFSDCESLTSIVVPNGVTNIEKNTFNSCCSLESVSLPASMTSIGEAAFSGCDMLQSITLPAGITTIEKDTFLCCAGLTGITIPSTVTSIGENAFGGCSGLTNIMIPASVTNINKAAFDGCKGLTGVEVAEENEVYYSEQNCIIRKDNAELVLGCKNSIIPNNVKSIGAYAFSGCWGLNNITIPNGVISIGDCAFYDCKGLTSITIPDSVVNFGEFAIDGNEDDFVIYASADSAAANWAKENNIPVRYVSTEEDPDQPGPGGEEDPNQPDNPGGTETPDQPGTPGNNGGTTNPGTGNNTNPPAAGPQPSTTVPKAAGTKLTVQASKCEVKVVSSDKTSPAVTYTKSSNASAKTVKIPDTVVVDGVTYQVTSVAPNAFKGNKKMKSVTVGKNVTTIGKSAFENCKNLTSVTLNSKSLKKIEANAFKGNKKLKKITIKSTKLTKKSVGKNALKGTNKKLVIKVPKKQLKNYKKYFKNKGNKTVSVKK